MADHVPAKALRALDARDGRVCVMTATEGDRLVPQHRAGGMGGRRDKHQLPRLLWLDSIVNDLIESDPEWQAVAMARGVKIWLDTDPGRVPVYYRGERSWFVLQGATRRPIPATTALDMMHDVYGDQYLLWKAIADRTDRAMVLLERAVL